MDSNGRNWTGTESAEMRTESWTKLLGMCSKWMKRDWSDLSASTSGCILLSGRPAFRAAPERAVLVSMKWIDSVPGMANFSSNSCGISLSFSALAFSSLSASSFRPFSPRRSFCAAARSSSSFFSVADIFSDGIPKIVTWAASEIHFLMKARHWSSDQVSRTSYSFRVATSIKVEPSRFPYRKSEITYSANEEAEDSVENFQVRRCREIHSFKYFRSNSLAIASWRTSKNLFSTLSNFSVSTLVSVKRTSMLGWSSVE